MCAYLNGFQCAVIFCVVVMSAIVYGTSDTFITFFHCVRLLLFGTHLFCPVFEKTYCYFFLFLLY